MTHATILVIHDESEDVADLMAPYWDLDLSEEELRKDPRASFDPKLTVKEMSDNWMKWERREAFESEPGSGFFYRRGVGLGDRSYGSAEEFARDYYGYHKSLDGKAYGYYHNVDGRWDWYEIGGRWAGSLQMKAGKDCFLPTRSMFAVAEPGTCDSARKGDIDEKTLKKMVTNSILSNKWIEPNSRIKNTDRSARFEELPEKMLHQNLDDYVRDGKCGSGEWEYMEKYCNALDKYYERKGSVYRLKPKYSGNRNLEDDIKKYSGNQFQGQQWVNIYHDRFIKDLHPDVILTVIDYHV